MDAHPLTSHHRYKSIDDFPEGDIRRYYPRFQPENFPKNLELVDKFHAVARKYNATPAQVALAWILAEHPDSESSPRPALVASHTSRFLTFKTYPIPVIPIPGSRGIARTEENARGAEIALSAEDQKALRDAVDNATVAGGRMPPEWAIEHDCIPMEQWKGEEGWKMPEASALAQLEV